MFGSLCGLPAKSCPYPFLCNDCKWVQLPQLAGTCWDNYLWFIGLHGLREPKEFLHVHVLVRPTVEICIYVIHFCRNTHVHIIFMPQSYLATDCSIHSPTPGRWVSSGSVSSMVWSYKREEARHCQFHIRTGISGMPGGYPS